MAHGPAPLWLLPPPGPPPVPRPLSAELVGAAGQLGLFLGPLVPCIATALVLLGVLGLYAAICAGIFAGF